MESEKNKIKCYKQSYLQKLTSLLQTKLSFHPGNEFQIGDGEVENKVWGGGDWNGRFGNKGWEDWKQGMGGLETRDGRLGNKGWEG